MLKIAIETLGCKVNQAESETMSRRLAAAGYELVSPDDNADVYILNTCTVTHAADRKSRHWLRLAHRRNPAAVLVVTGCYAERAAGDISRLDGVKLVVGNTDKSRLVEMVDGLTGRTCQTGLTSPIPARTRTFIKVQDGCRNFCSYCIVPFVRRDESSLPPEEVIAEIKQRQAEGYQEIVITGVEVGSYRSELSLRGRSVSVTEPGVLSRDLPYPLLDSCFRRNDSTTKSLVNNTIDLTSLLSLILTETTIPRLRLSSLQPPEVTPELIGLWRDPRLCRHFHLSLQSGSDPVLKRMNRRYTTAEYAAAVALIRSAAPEAAVTTDIIVGFPGETEEEFVESYDFCKRMDFARIHVFPYSPRNGTNAASLPGRVDEKVKKVRTNLMLESGDKCISNFSRRFLGRTMPVLFEQKEKDGLWSGLTDNYIRVYLRNEEDLTNKIVKIHLMEVQGDGVKGAII